MSRLLIVDDVRFNGHVLAQVLHDEPDLDVAGLATTVDEAMEQADGCDLVLVSSTLPNNGTTELVTRLRDAGPNLKILGLGLVHEPHLILHHIEAGVNGYVLREGSVDDLLQNVRAALHGQALASPEIVALLMQRLAELARLAEEQGFDLSKPLDLTPREREVLEHLAEGLTNQQIADRLYISEGTVKNHVHNILDKLNVSNRDEASAYYFALEKKRG